MYSGYLPFSIYSKFCDNVTNIALSFTTKIKAKKIIKKTFISGTKWKMVHGPKSLRRFCDIYWNGFVTMSHRTDSVLDFLSGVYSRIYLWTPEYSWIYLGLVLDFFYNACLRKLGLVLSISRSILKFFHNISSRYT